MDAECLPLISVVTPTYNAGSLLEETVGSVRAQTHAQWEHILVDDGSADGTADLACQLARGDTRMRVIRQRNAGVASARNRGFAERDPQSRYVIFLDQDDLWEADALEVLCAALAARPECCAAHGIARYLDAAGRPCRPGELEAPQRRRMAVGGRGLVPIPAGAPTPFAVIAHVSPIPTPGQVLIRCDALERVGPLDPEAAPCDDWDLWLRLSAAAPFAFADKTVIGWRQHGGNASRQRARMTEKMEFVRRKVSDAPGFSSEQKTAVERGRALAERDTVRLRLLWARGCLRHGQMGEGVRHLYHASRACLTYLRG